MSHISLLFLCLLQFSFYSILLCDNYKNYSFPLRKISLNREWLKNQYDNVHIKNEDIPIITKELTQDLAAVKKLEIQSSNVTSIQEGSFYNLRLLKKLSLKDNFLHEIKNNIFSNLRIEELDLSNNLISVIEAEAFDSMWNLKRINLRNNEINNYDNRWFVNVPFLSNINFENNFITYLPREILGRNKFYYIDFIMSYNRLEEIDEDAFYGIYRFSRLYLDHNGLSTISKEIFRYLSEIRDLRLDNNNIVCIAVDLKKVRYGNLDFNPWNEECWRRLIQNMNSNELNITTTSTI
ncbi:hypothetical protein Zmor_020205 [Zophobas morio]|uniref:Uncharacterized protein n=1 Tax=Zophobas morio TaxID=2755281 RepID=A0AA38I2G0_9CUCU|nr:hypothetical protein Zmor_020205 [Zophobas morio]